MVWCVFFVELVIVRGCWCGCGVYLFIVFHFCCGVVASWCWRALVGFFLGLFSCFFGSIGLVLGLLGMLVGWVFYWVGFCVFVRL